MSSDAIRMMLKDHLWVMLRALVLAWTCLFPAGLSTAAFAEIEAEEVVVEVQEAARPERRSVEVPHDSRGELIPPTSLRKHASTRGRIGLSRCGHFLANGLCAPLVC